MRIILHPHDRALRADLIEMVSAAHFAIANGLMSKAEGETMCVTRGEDYRNTFGVIRRKGSLSVYPPDPIPASPPDTQPIKSGDAAP